MELIKAAGAAAALFALLLAAACQSAPVDDAADPVDTAEAAPPVEPDGPVENAPDETGEAAPVACAPEIIRTVSVIDRGDVRVWRSGPAVGFTSHMFVNADGAPDAYRPDGSGLSFTCDGLVAFESGRCVFPSGNPDWQPRCNAAYARALAADWDGEHVCVFGFEMAGGRRVGNATVGGRPLIQGADDPRPGNYVSATAMRVKDAPPQTQRRYVDSRRIPFFVLPGALRTQIGASVGARGSVGIVARAQSGRTVSAVAADLGPSWQLGEGSIALHRAVGSDPMIVRDGVERAKRNILDDVTYVVFPDVTVEGVVDADAFGGAIDAAAQNAFAAWGGAEKLNACVVAASR